MPIMRNPSRTLSEVQAPSSEHRPRVESGEYPTQRETLKMWAVHPEAENPHVQPDVSPDSAVPEALRTFTRPTIRRAGSISQTDLPAVVTRPRNQPGTAKKPEPGPRRYTAVQMDAVKAPLRAEPETPAALPSSKKQTHEEKKQDGQVAHTRMLDDHDFFGDVDETIVLELDALPAGHVGFDTMAGPSSSQRMVRFTPQPMEAVTQKTKSGEMPALSSTPTPSRDMAPPSAPAPSSVARRTTSTTMAAVSSAVVVAVGDPRRPGIFAFAGFGIAPEKLSEMPAYALRVMSRRRILRRDLATARARRANDVELYEAALRMVDEAALNKGLALLMVMVCAVFLAIGMAFAVVS